MTVTGRTPRAMPRWGSGEAGLRKYLETDFAEVEQRIMQHYTSGRAVVDELHRALAPRPSMFERVTTRLAQLLCRHSRVLHFEGRRVMLRCTSCGHDTPGWDTTRHRR